MEDKRKKQKDPWPVHGFSLHVSKPNPQIWREVLSCQLQHGDIPSTVKLQEQTRTDGFKQEHPSSPQQDVRHLFLRVPVSSLPQAQGWRVTGRGPSPHRKCTQPCPCWWLSRRRRRWSSPCLVPLGMEWPGRRKEKNKNELLAVCWWGVWHAEVTAAQTWNWMILSWERHRYMRSVSFR